MIGFIAEPSFSFLAFVYLQKKIYQIPNIYGILENVFTLAYILFILVLISCLICGILIIRLEELTI